MHSVTYLESIRSQKRRPTFFEVADLIDIDFEPWVPNLLEWWGSAIQYDRAFETHYPTNSEQNRLLSQMYKAIEDVRSNTLLLSSLSRELRRALSVSQQLLDSEIAKRSAANGAVRRGRGKFGSTSAKTLCAARVREIWFFFHGRYPGPGNYRAAALAEALWVASGGNVNAREVDDPVGHWRYDFQRVKDLIDDPKIDQYRLRARFDLAQANRLRRAPWFFSAMNNAPT